MEETKQTLDWNAIKGSAARFLFDLYGDQSDLYWARIIWNSLDRRGYTEYSGTEEKHRVLLRLMTLAVICQEFCFVAWKVGENPPLGDWADELEMDPEVVAALVGGDFPQRIEDEADDNFPSYEEALREGVEMLRPELFHQMVDMFGGKAFLFASLWKIGNTGYLPPEEEMGNRDWSEWSAAELTPNPDAEYRETISDVLNEVDPEKMEAFEWVDNGMHPVWW